MQSGKPNILYHQYTFEEIDFQEIFYFNGEKFVKKTADSARNLDQHETGLTTFKDGDKVGVCAPRWLDPTY